MKANKFEDSILKPLTSQFSTENWRVKVQTLDILGKIIMEQQIYSPFIADTLTKEMRNKIEAVRLKASNVIIKVIKKSPKEWCEAELLPLIIKIRE
jgi:hypothetical protein